MDDDELPSDVGSANTDSENDFLSDSEEEDNSNWDPPTDDNIDTTEMLKTFKHVQEALCGFSKFIENKGKASSSGVDTRSVKGAKAMRGKGKEKSNVAVGASERPGSRFNSKYFAEKIISKLDRRKRKIIEDHGFGILLEYDGCSAPRGFVQWIADHLDVNCGDIDVGGKLIPFDALSVHLFLGIPYGGADIKKSYTDSTKAAFLKEIKEPSLPTIKSFGKKLLGETLSDDDVFRYFMVVALSTFLCANSNTYPSPMYLGALIDLSKVKDWDWSKLVYDCLFSSIRNYRMKKRLTLGGCIYLLAGYYLDFVDFGRTEEVPLDLPRIRCWKGSMIKTYSSYDRVSHNIYGKRPVKPIGETVYADKCLPAEACDVFRSEMSRRCDFLSDKDKNEMCQIFEKHHSRLGFRHPGILVSKIFSYLHEEHCSRRADDAPCEDESSRRATAAAAKADVSATRVASPSHNDVADDASHAAYDSPLPSSVRQGFLDDGFTAAPMDNVVEEVDLVAGPNDKGLKGVDVAGSASDKATKEVDAGVGEDNIVEDIHANETCTATRQEREATVTEIMESDGLYDGVVDDDRRFTQSTEILPSSNLSPRDSVRIDVEKKTISPTQVDSVAASGSMKRKRRNKESEASSPDSVASLSQRKMSLRMSTRLASLRSISGAGSMEDNPIVVEEDAPVETLKCGRKGKGKVNPSSASTEVVASDGSQCQADSTRIRTSKRKTSESPIPVIASPKCRVGRSKDIGRSPLSRVDDRHDGVKKARTASSPVHGHEKVEGEKTSAAVGASFDELEKATVQEGTSHNPSASLNHVEHAISGVKNSQNDSSRAPGLHKESELDEQAAPVEPNIGKTPPVIKFNSPSMPSYRIFEDEDDFGNFIEDPKLRRPFPTESATSCPLERSKSLMRFHTATSCPVGGVRSAMSSGLNTDVRQGVNTGQENWVFDGIRNLWSNPALGKEETVVTENDGTQRDDNVQPDAIHMVSVPFTEYSENPEASAARAPCPLPLAAISSTGAQLDITPSAARCPRYSVAGGSSLSGRNIGSNGMSNDSESLSSEAGWQSSSAKLAIHRPRRQFIPSKFKLSPYMIPNSKIKVSRLEADVYGVVLTMAESSEHSDLSVVNYRSVVVKLSALASSLKPQGQVHYFVVNALCRLLFHRNHPKISYKHYFFSKVGDYLIGNHGPNDSKEKELFDNAMKCFKGANHARPLSSSNYFYFPILFHGRWFVVVVYVPNRWIVILDSNMLQFGVDSAFHKAVCDEFVPNLIDIWKKVVKIDYGLHGYRVWFANVPQQNDNLSNDDSGIFAMKNLELYEANADLMVKYSEADIPHLRIKYVNEMIWNEHNIAYDCRAKVEQYDPEVYEKYYKRP